MYQHILIPVAPGHFDDYETALRLANRLLADGGKVSVVSVLEEPPVHMGAYVPMDFSQKHMEELGHDIVKAFGDRGVEPHVVPGHATHTILAWSGDHDVDCIIVNSHQPAFSDLLLGSTASRIVRQAKVPVMVLR